MSNNDPFSQLTISFKALQRARTTIADFVASYFPYVGLNIPEDFFKHLDVLVFVEATIYQLDEDNEALASQGLVEPGKHLLEESVLIGVLDLLGLLNAGIKAELKQGDVYWEGERKLCSAMHKRGCAPRHAPQRHRQQEDGRATELQQQQQQKVLQAHQDGGELQQPWEEFTLSDVIAVHESKSFDYRVLHLLMSKLADVTPDPRLLDFLKVDELLVDIGDDLVDYEVDVEQNSFNIFRCYVHLFGPEAPRMLVQRISDLEQQHAQLLQALPFHLQEHWRARHKEASLEGGSSDGAGAWEFPSIIYDEAAFRENEDREQDGSSD